MERPQKNAAPLELTHVDLVAKNLSDKKVCDGMLKRTKTVCICVIMQTIQVGFTNTD